jgi:arylsulfatase A-like enzyme
MIAVLWAASNPSVRAADSSNTPAPAKQSRPNIIFILFDDLGYGQPPVFRAESPYTMPSLDRLAREGMRFTDAHSAASVCTPTRYGVLTGRSPWRIGQFGVLNHKSPPIIGAGRLTVASLLKSQGYHTACFGKWHLGMKIQGKEVTDGPTARGFDTFCGYTEARSISKVIENGRVVGTFPEVEVAPLLARKTAEYLKERAAAKEPFFLCVPLSQPHTPIVPASEFSGKSGQGAYGDWILQGDAVVGQILDALDRHHLTDNTLVLVSSDNGAAGRVYPPLRGCKTTIWEGGHREPFFARWPGKIKPASVCDDTICLNDLLATYAEIVGVKLPDDAAEDSVSILPDLLGTAKGPVREATVHQSLHGDLAIRQGPWKLVFLAGGAKELYNLKDDLSETKDLASGQPEIVARLTGLMQQYIDRGRSTPGSPQKNGAKISLTDPRGRKKKARSEPE